MSVISTNFKRAPSGSYFVILTEEHSSDFISSVLGYLVRNPTVLVNCVQLCGCPTLTDEQSRMLGGFLTGNDTTNHIYLAAETYTLATLTYIAKALRHNDTLKGLIVWRTPGFKYEKAAECALVESLRRRSRPEWSQWQLFIDDESHDRQDLPRLCQLAESGTPALLADCETGSRGYQITLTDKCDADSIDQLLVYLANNPSLKVEFIIFANCSQISIEQSKYLGAYIARNTTLDSIHLWPGVYTHETLMYVARGLRMNYTLRELVIWRTPGYVGEGAMECALITSLRTQNRSQQSHWGIFIDHTCLERNDLPRLREKAFPKKPVVWLHNYPLY